MTIFTGLLSIQSVVGSSADTLTSKTAKYVISNCVPVVGGAVSDAYSTVKGSLSLLKNGIGGVGIATCYNGIAVFSIAYHVQAFCFSSKHSCRNIRNVRYL